MPLFCKTFLTFVSFLSYLWTPVLNQQIIIEWLFSYFSILCFRDDDVIITTVGKEIVQKIPGNGLCALNAVIQRMKFKNEIIPNLEEMTAKIQNELLNTLEFYGKGIDEGDHITYQLNNYVYNHIYNSNIVDIVLLLISNAYKMVINVFIPQNDHYVLYRSRKITPRENTSQSNINLLKTGDHFDSLFLKSKFVTNM